jgi:ribonuclease G
LDRQILVNVEPMEVRVAVLEDGQLAELLIERPMAQRIAGNIYKGRVDTVLPGMEAAFVHIGYERNAFLYAGDAGAVFPAGEGGEGQDRTEGEGEGEADDPDEGGLPPPPGQGRRSIQELVRAGQEIIVQVAKEAVGTKGPRVTTNLSLPGRYLVLAPTMDYVGVSRRIADERERARLRQLAEELRPAHTGVIVRTVAEGHSDAEIAQDMAFLTRLWERIRERARSAEAPALLHRDMGLTFRVVRDLLTEEVSRVVVDNHHEYRRMLELAEVMSPDLKRRIRFWSGKGGNLFDAHKVEGEIDKLLRAKVWLKSGGYLVIDQSEALTTIDVNTGKYVGTTSLADTVLHTNLEAADEIARQIRLRDIAGIIIVDFIDMDRSEDQREVLERLSQAVKRDRTKVHVLGLTQLGLVEMTRKKVGAGLEATLLKTCPYCDGRGRVMSEETMSQRVRRLIKAEFRRSDAEAILVEVHPAVAAVLIGAGGSNLKEFERETGRAIFVRGSAQARPDAVSVIALGTRAEVERRARPVSVGETLEVRVEEPHAVHPQNGIARVEGYVLDIEHGAAHVGQRVRVEVVATYRTYAKARIAAPRAAVPGGEGAAAAAGAR